MRSLIVNVDDVGISPEVNEAAGKCYREGIISGVSVMPCGESFKEAADMLRELEKIDVGVHLTLTGKFHPCSDGISEKAAFIGPDNTFVDNYMDLMTLYGKKGLNSENVYLELSEQIRKVQEEGLEVTHLDSHEHVHMLPEILEITIGLAEEFKVPYVRLPLERAGIVRKRFSLKNLIRHTALKCYSLKGKKPLSEADLRHNDAFLGHFHAGCIDDDVLCFMLENLPDGISELAVHPSVMSRGFTEKFPWYKGAHNELEALVNGKWKDLISSKGIRLLSHKEASDGAGEGT